jgi:hypothetical protein
MGGVRVHALAKGKAMTILVILGHPDPNSFTH